MVLGTPMKGSFNSKGGLNPQVEKRCSKDLPWLGICHIPIYVVTAVAMGIKHVCCGVPGCSSGTASWFLDSLKVAPFTVPLLVRPCTIIN